MPGLYDVIFLGWLVGLEKMFFWWRYMTGLVQKIIFDPQTKNLPWPNKNISDSKGASLEYKTFSPRGKWISALACLYPLLHLVVKLLQLFRISGMLFIIISTSSHWLLIAHWRVCLPMKANKVVVGCISLAYRSPLVVVAFSFCRLTVQKNFHNETFHKNWKYLL